MLETCEPVCIKPHKCQEEEKISTIGITGKIASGKSAVAGSIASISGDAVVLDVDSIAKGLYEKYPETKKELKSVFGDGIFTPDGLIDFKKLSIKVFSSKKDLFKLNRIMFPRIRQEVKNLVKAQKKHKHKVIDAAVLFGAKLDIICDYIILVESDEKIRKKFLKNKKLSDNEIELKIRGQHIDINESSVDFKIINDGDKEKLLDETVKILEDIESREKTRDGTKQV